MGSEARIPVTGGCLCGAVRYESAAPPNLVGFCHCRMCQKAYGGLFAIFADFPGDAFRFTSGEPRYYRSSEWIDSVKPIFKRHVQMMENQA